MWLVTRCGQQRRIWVLRILQARRKRHCQEQFIGWPTGVRGMVVAPDSLCNQTGQDLLQSRWCQKAASSKGRGTRQGQPPQQGTTLENLMGGGQLS